MVEVLQEAAAYGSFNSGSEQLVGRSIAEENSSSSK
jgi:hypothetical protein